METKELTDNALRAAFEYLRRSRKTVLQDVATAVSCSRRHLQAVLSLTENKPMGGKLANKIAEYYGLDYGQFLELGECILNGAKGEDVLKSLRVLAARANPETRHVDGVLPFVPPSSNVEPAALPDRSRRVPVISFVRAGDWTEAEAVEPSWAEDWIESSVGGARVFALRVKGDSMEPVFREGEIILVDPDREAVNGDYVVAALEREEATLKRWERVGGRDLLIPLNPRYQPIDVTGQDWRVIGRVLEKRQIF